MPQGIRDPYQPPPRCLAESLEVDNSRGQLLYPKTSASPIDHLQGAWPEVKERVIAKADPMLQGINNLVDCPQDA